MHAEAELQFWLFISPSELRALADRAEHILGTVSIGQSHTFAEIPIGRDQKHNLILSASPELGHVYLK